MGNALECGNIVKHVGKYRGQFSFPFKLQMSLVAFSMQMVPNQRCTRSAKTQRACRRPINVDPWRCVQYQWCCQVWYFQNPIYIDLRYQIYFFSQTRTRFQTRQCKTMCHGAANMTQGILNPVSNVYELKISKKKLIFIQQPLIS